MPQSTGPHEGIWRRELNVSNASETPACPPALSMHHPVTDDADDGSGLASEENVAFDFVQDARMSAARPAGHL